MTQNWHNKTCEQPWWLFDYVCSWIPSLLCITKIVPFLRKIHVNVKRRVYVKVISTNGRTIYIIVFYSSLSSICVFHKCENKTVKSSKSLRCRSRYLTAKCYRRHVEHWTHFFFLFTGRWAFLKKKPEEPNEKKFQDVVPIIFTLNFQQGKDVITWMLVRRAAAGKKKKNEAYGWS